jgi:hypothetical protein
LHQSPYRYNVYPAQAINAAALQAISGLGFSFQQNSKPPPFPECDAASEKHKDGFERFWTDYLTLDEVQLAKMGLSWAQLGIAPDESLVYQFCIVGCYYTAYDGSNTPFIQPEAVHLPSDLGLCNTDVTLILKVDMRRRARKSAFSEVSSSSISPKPLLDVLAAKLHAAVSNVPTEIYPTENRIRTIGPASRKKVVDAKFQRSDPGRSNTDFGRRC